MIMAFIVLSGFLGSIALFIFAHFQERRARIRCEQERLAWEMEQKRKKMEYERLARALQLADVDNMEGIGFEHYVCRLLVSQGYNAHVTKASNDLGADIIAERNGLKYSIQTKRHKSSISRRAVSDALGGRDFYDCNLAMVVTNSYFTPGAVEMAEKTHCRLVDRDKLAKWIADYQNPTTPEFAVAGFEGA